MNFVHKLQKGQTFLDECKAICQIKPTSATLHDIKQNYHIKIMLFVDLVFRTPLKRIEPLCTNKTHTCDRTILGRKNLFGHMIHFLQDEILFNQTLGIASYRDLSKIVCKFIKKNDKLSEDNQIDNIINNKIIEHTKQLNNLQREYGKVRRQHRRIETELSRDTGRTINYFILAGLSKRSKELEDEIASRKENGKKNIYHNNRTESEIFEDNMREIDSQNNMKSFRLKIHNTIDEYIQNDDKESLNNAKTLLLKVKYLREFDNYCKRGDSNFKTYQEHAVFIFIISEFIKYIDRFAFKLFNPDFVPYPIYSDGRDAPGSRLIDVFENISYTNLTDDC